MPKSRVQPLLVQSAHMPAPVGGLNTISAGSAMPPEDCVALWNMIPAEYGLRTRLGWREWATGLDGEVRSLLPFTGPAKDGSQNRLFACTQTGIWDVTEATDAPLQVVEFPIQGDDSGWGAYTAHTTNAGQFLVYTDEANGLYIYRAATSDWVKAAQGADPLLNQIDGVDPASFVHVLSFKGALWFTQRDTPHGWYLPPGQIFGAATKFNFGNKMKAGGDLRGLWSWSFDGGSGIDDALVAISGGGDVFVYKVTDPTQPTGIALQGVWFVGAVPAGRRICTESGGDLLIMSSLGLLPLSRLASGANAASTQYETYKVGHLFSLLQMTVGKLRGWAARFHPADGTLLILVPRGPGLSCEQLAMSVTNKAWARYRGLPVGACAEALNGALFFGTVDGRVCANTGFLDGVKLDGTGGEAVEFSLLTSFQNLGRPTQKRVQMIRPTFLSAGEQPQYRAEARYRWDLTEPVAPDFSNPPAAAGFAVWDTAKWDEDRWLGAATSDPGAATVPQQLVFGAHGIGPEVALAIRGRSVTRMTLVGVDVTFDEGGFL